MAILRLLLLLLVATSRSARAFYDSSKDDVETITSFKEFESKVLQDEFFWLIQFYDASAHATAMPQQASLYGAVSKVLKGMIHVGAVDVSTAEGSKIAATYHQTAMSKLPTIVILLQDKKNPVETITQAVQPEELIQKVFGRVSQVISSRMGTTANDDGNRAGGAESSSSPRKRRTAFATVTGANFDEMVLNNPQVVLVAFTAPWCGHCKHLEPEFKQAGKDLASEEALLAWVNAEEEQALSSMYGVNGFPTIKLFRGGKGKSASDAKDFMYERSAEAITAAVLEEVGRTGVPKEIPELTSQAIFQDECQGSNRICVLAALPHILDSGADGRNKYRDLLSTISKNFKGVGAFSFSWFEGGGEAQPGLEKAFDLTFGFPALVAFSMDRKAYAVLHGSFSEKQISAFLHAITTGRQGTVKIEDVPKVKTIEPWDGKDGAPIEEEFDLSELFDDDDKEEL